MFVDGDRSAVFPQCGHCARGENQVEQVLHSSLPTREHGREQRIWRIVKPDSRRRAQRSSAEETGASKAPATGGESIVERALRGFED